MNSEDGLQNIFELEVWVYMFWIVDVMNYVLENNKLMFLFIGNNMFVYFIKFWYVFIGCLDDLDDDGIYYYYDDSLYYYVYYCKKDLNLYDWMVFDCYGV